ncbi:acyltransferase family protein [Streptomyces daliensis]
MSSATLGRTDRSDHTDRTVAAAQAGAGADGAARDPFLDNAKFLLVVLVVIGHGWGPISDEMRGLKTLYLVVYAFHMPVFVFLCGYFSRGFTGSPEQIRKLVAGVLLPYLVFETVYAGLYALLWDDPFPVSPSDPLYLCWFLLALFLWRLTAPLWRAVRWPVAVAAVISVAAGALDVGYELGLARVLMFLPWFVLGLRMRREHLRPLRCAAARRLALPVLVTAVAGAWCVAPYVSTGWLLMQHGAADLGVPDVVYVPMRLALFAVSAVVGAAFLALVPGRRAGCTALGAATMYPFLLHGLVIKTFEGAGGYDIILSGGLLAGAVLTVATTALALGLYAPPVRRVLRPLVEPRFPRWLEPDAERGGRRDAERGSPGAERGGGGAGERAAEHRRPSPVRTNPATDAGPSNTS